MIALVRPPNPYTHRRYPSNFFPTPVVRDLLLLVSVEVAAEIIRGWSDLQREIAGDWALRSHLRASDNNTVRVPEKPDFIPEFRQLNREASTVMEL
jgi:hypothetical protein